MVGGGGVHVNLTKKTSDSVVCLFLIFAFFLVLGLFTEVKWLIQREISFFKVPEGVQIFPGGAGGGGNCLLSIETQITCDFPGGSGPPGPSPLDPHLAAIYLVSQSAQ